MLTPLCVWFYFGCASSRPAVSSEEKEDARRMEEIVERLPVHDTSRPAARDTGAVHPAPIPENREIGQGDGDAAHDTAGDSVAPPAIMREKAKAILDSVSRREQAIIALQDRFAQFAAQMHKEMGDGVSPDSVRAMAIEDILPLVDSLGALGLELPPADESLPGDEDMMRRITEMLSAAHAGIGQARMDVMAADSALVAAMRDTLPKIRPPRKPFLDDPIYSKNKDSMVYDVRNDTIWLYREASVDYQDLNMKADVLSVSTITKMINAHGIETDSGGVTRPVFTQGGQPMDMKIVSYNLDTREGIVRDFAMQEGEGYMHGDLVKIHADKHFDMAEGRYTTCNHVDCPHFYIRMNRGKVIPDNKVIFGMAHFVLEDVPLYFPFVPFGFFPLASGPSSGFIMPTFGEEYVKGFFIRDGGYYFRFNDYIDATVTGSVYTLGSWDAKATSRYLKRYKYSGSFDVKYSKNIVGEKGSSDYVNGNSINVNWNHSQDPKFRPNSNFSASVQFASSGSKKYASTTVEDYIKTQTSSSISYSKTIPASEQFPGANFTVAFRHSQNASDSTISFSFPQASWSVQKFKPFQNKDRRGKEKWYEKITLSYSGGMQGSLDNIKEKDLFTAGTLDKFKSGIEHKIPVSASFSMLNYINFTVSGNYNERWMFKKQNLWWDEVNRTVAGDTTTGFYRTYDYGGSGSLSTKIYGMYQFKNPNGLFKAIRHVITPSVSISVKPDFGKAKYGFYETYQSGEDGRTTIYSPYSALNYYGAPGRGESATMSFSLQQNLEAKVRDQRDTTGYRKIVMIENLSLSGGYNLLADSMNLSTIGFTLTIPVVKQFKLNLTGTLDPYEYDPVGKTRYNRFTFADGKLPRLTRLSTSFNWSWAPTFGSQTTIEQYERSMAMIPHVHDPDSPLDQEQMRALMAAAYYDFSIPFNFGVSYSMTYSNDRQQRQLQHSVNFNGSLTLTPYKANGQARWAISLPTIGYNFTDKKLTPGSVSVIRDLHCFTMSFNWTPIGPRSWSFNIRIKSDVLKDIKYDKNRSYYDTLYE